MTVLFVLVPLALALAGSAVVAFLWAVKNGQLDDLDTPAVRILHDDREPTAAPSASDRSYRPPEAPCRSSTRV